MLFFLSNKSYSAPFLKESLPISGKKNAVFFQADFNQDGALDFLFSGYDGQANNTRIQFQKKDGFAANNYSALPVFGAVENVVALDVDLDGVLELVLSEEINGKQQLQFIKKEGAAYVKQTSVLNTFSFDSLRIEVCDFNFDAYPDLLVFGLNATTSEVVLLENNQKGGFWTKKLSLPNNQNLSYVFRQQQEGELLWSKEDQSTSLYTLSADGEVTEQNTTLPFLEGSFNWLDINGDGEEELFVNGFLNSLPFKGILNHQFQRDRTFNFRFQK